MSQSWMGCGDTTYLSPRSGAAPGAPGQPSAPAFSFPDDELVRTGRLVGRYRCQHPLACGGMGVVLQAHDLTLDRTVALKVLRPQLATHHPSHVRFLQEARILGELQHPGIVPVFDAGTLEDGRPYFAMKLVEGESLDRPLTQRSSPHEDLPRYLRILEGVSQTIAFAHTRGVTHRDLKPLNVMVGVYGEVLVMDWGLSRRRPLVVGPPESATSPANSAAGVSTAVSLAGGQGLPPCDAGQSRGVLGTPAYLAPEQILGLSDDWDPRVDVFGLGAILCEILTGRPPYWDEDPREVLVQALNAHLTPALDRLAQCGANRELVALAQACIAAERNDRPPDAGIIATALARFLDLSVRAAEADLVRFFELSQDLFCIATLDGFFRRVNPNFSRVLGYTDDQLLARPFIDFVHPCDREATQQEVAQLALGRPVVSFRNRYRDSQGSFRWLEWSAKAIPNDGIIFAVAREVVHGLGETADTLPIRTDVLTGDRQPPAATKVCVAPPASARPTHPR